MKLKRFNNFKINEEFEQEESGEILLTYNGESPTTWYYVGDAIIDGLLEEKLQLDDDIIETFCEEQMNETYCGQSELADMIESDFENVIGKLLKYLKQNDIIDEMPSSVIIKGTSEDNEEYDLSYYPE
jgi:hypothetical protein